MENNKPRCFKCGGAIIWDSDCMRSEVDLCDEENDTIVRFCHCTTCVVSHIKDTNLKANRNHSLIYIN